MKLDPDGDRRLIESAVTGLLAQAPQGWTRMHAEIDSGMHPVVVSAAVTLPDASERPLAVPAEVMSALTEHQRRAAATGAPWRRLLIDCHADGRLSVHTDPLTDRPRRWPQRALAAITVGCFAAAAVVFALGGRPSPPPRAAMIPVADPPPNQNLVLGVTQAWYEAKNRGDAAGMRAVVCTQPAPRVEEEIEVIEQRGNIEDLTYIEAVVAFRDEGSQLWARFAGRIDPLSARMQHDVEDAQRTGGFFDDQYIFVMEDGKWKLCDSDLPQHQ